jgi:hypothetical protein
VTLDVTDAAHDARSFADMKGVVPPSQPGGRSGFLDDVIVELGFADPTAVASAVEQARQPGLGGVGRVLVDNGEITEDELARAIAERNGLSFVDLSVFEIDPTAQSLIGRSEALRYRAIPIAFTAERSLVVALADPLDGLAISDIAVMTKSELIPAVANEKTIAELAAAMPERPTRFAYAEDEAAELDPPGGEPAETVEAAPDGISPLDEFSEPAPEAAAPPPATAEQVPAVTEAEPRPVRESDVEALRPAFNGATANLRDRIVELVETALDETAGSEIERLESELETERAARAELEAERAEDQASRESMATALEESSRRIEELEARIGELEGRLSDVTAERDATGERLSEAEASLADVGGERDAHRERVAELETKLTEVSEQREDQSGRIAELEAQLSDATSERDLSRERLGELEAELSESSAEREGNRSRIAELEARASETAAERDGERDRRADLEARLRKRVAAATASDAELQGALERLIEAISDARGVSDRITTLHGELANELPQEPHDEPPAEQADEPPAEQADGRLDEPQAS